MDDRMQLLPRLRALGNAEHDDLDVAHEAADEIERLRAEPAALKTVMIAAAEEIAAHWDAHCDAEGYGPQNLLRRLKAGIPSEYGYTAGAFAELKAERDALRAELAAEKAEVFRVQCEYSALHHMWAELLAERANK